MMKNKKGSHVGVVISFVIFITFLLFLYIIFQPTITTQKNKEPVLENLKNKLIENLSAEMTSVSLEIKNNVQEKEVLFVNFLNQAGLENPNVIVKDKTGNILNSEIFEDDLSLERQDTEDVFFKIYQSNEFEFYSGVGGTPINFGDYDFGLIRKKKYIFEKKIFSLLERYMANYEDLKKEFEVPDDSKFGFDFEFNNKSSVGTSVGDLSTSVYVREIPVEYIDSDANVLIGRLDLKVW